MLFNKGQYYKTLIEVKISYFIKVQVIIRNMKWQ